ncbi:hypothetical protein EXE53_04200 [Halorubrum sp. SD626R]|uniref:hypothetical protein n=1 Tax=Halorubrum TaxID=56688 RepID=UPI0010F573F6|nr:MULTISPECIES: hypothetical protein [Halorubrum]TKX82010.1 hypothetical protein EXE53_04200 [Halorubrum sp. SD626R]
MAVCDSPGDGHGTVTLPAVIPFDLDHLTRMSWELGSRTVRDPDATRIGRWCAESRRWELSAFDVTRDTVVLRVHTPVGRTRFYGAIAAEAEPALRTLADTSEWAAVDEET